MLKGPRTPQPLAGLGTCEYATLCGYGGAEYPHGLSAYPCMPLDMAENSERLSSEVGIIIGEGIGQFGAAINVGTGVAMTGADCIDGYP